MQIFEQLFYNEIIIFLQKKPRLPSRVRAVAHFTENTLKFSFQI